MAQRLWGTSTGGSKLYMHLTASTAPAGLTLPSGALDSYTTTTGSNVGATAGDLSFCPMTAQVSLAGQSLTTSGNTSLIAQMCSCPLVAQPQIAAGNWVVGMAMSALTASRSHIAIASLFLTKSDGTARTTIFSKQNIGAATTATAETTTYGTTIAGSAFTPQDGDYLTLEIAWKNNSGTAQTATLYTSGTTVISSDAASTASAQSFIQPPKDIYFKGQFRYFFRQGTGFDTLSLKGFTTPTGALGSYTNSTTSLKGSGAGGLYDNAPSSGGGVLLPGQQTKAVNSIAASTTVLLGQFVGPALDGTANIPAMIWSVGYGLTISSASASAKGYVGIYLVNGSSGAIRTSISAAADLGAARAGTTEKTVFGGISGSSATVTAGDMIAIELGADNGVGATANFTLGTEGATAITADNATNTAAMAVVLTQYAIATAPTTQQAVATNTASTVTTLTIIPPLAINVGDLIVLATSWGNAAVSVSSITDTAGNHYRNANANLVDSGGISIGEVWYASGAFASAAGANTITVNYSGGGANGPDIRVVVYKGLDGNAPLDKTGASNTGATVSQTSSVATEAYVESCTADSVITAGATNGMVEINSAAGHIIESFFVGAAASYGLSASGSTMNQLSTYATVAINFAEPPRPVIARQALNRAASF